MTIGFGNRAGRQRWVGGATPTPSPPPPPAFTPPAGFALNGASNATLKAMIGRVRAGTGRGRIVWKGDSTTVGQGGGSSADAYGLTGARANRPPAVLASLLSAAGIATLDAALVGDNGMNQAGGFALAGYDPRFASGTGNFQVAQDFAGGAFRNPGTTADSFTPTVAVDRFEVVVYNSNAYTLAVLVDGAPPAAITVAGSSGAPAATVSGNSVAVAAPGTGYTRLIVAAETTGTHTLSWSANAINLAAIRSIRGYASGTIAIDQIVHAALGARADQQGKDNAATNLWGGLDALAFDAPDLTIVNCGLNDMAAGRTTGACAADLQAMVAKAKLSGDVLLVSPHPAGYGFAALATQQGYRDATAALAASNGVSYLSLFDYFGGASTPALQARMTDGSVHGNAGFYAEVGQVYRDCLRAMGGAV